MSQRLNKKKAEYLKHLADKADILKESAKNIVFTAMLDEAEQWAKEAGYTEDDVAEVIKSVRDREKA